MKSRKKLLSIPIILFLLLVPPNGNSCGPFIPDAVFVYHTHPGAPLPQYARGNLGVVLPDFSDHYLFVAYRYFAGRPLRPDEVDQVISFWKWQLTGPLADDNGKPDPASEWTEARKVLAGATGQAPQVGTDRTFGQYTNYHNCLPDAFHNAVLTLKDRAQRFGGASNDVQEWLHGQDMVFDNCAAGKNVPSPVAQSSPAWLKADRQYQIAAAHFYSGNFDQAAHEFDQIAADNASPWRSFAPYLAARAFIRKGTLKDETPAFDVAAMNEAHVRLKKIIADPSLASLHSASRNLLAYLSIRIDPAQRMHQLAPLMSAERSDPNLRQDLIDYVHGLNGVQGETPSFADQGSTEQIQAKVKEWKDQQFAGMADLRSHDDLTDWILTFSDSSDLARQHALEQWRKLHTTPWLVAAMAKVEAASADAELSQAAERVQATSPAYPTVLYYRLRLLIGNGAGEKARALLDKILPQFQKSLTPASLNLFLVMRMDLARSFDEFLSYAALPVIGTEDGSGYGPWSGYCGEKDCPDVFAEKKPDQAVEHRLDQGTAKTFNLYLTLQKLTLATQSKSLPEKLRGEIAASAWTRAVMLGRHDVAVTLVPEISKNYPSLKKQLEGYVAASTPQDKWHAGLFILLSDPGLRPYVNAGLARGTNIGEIDNFRDNWWCEDVVGWQRIANPSNDSDSDSTGENTNGAGAKPKSAPAYPRFLSSADIDAAKAEGKQLTASGTAPDYLTSKTVEWAREQPNDPRIPEALHLAVRSTRYGCSGKQTSGLSHKAFDLLHTRYPKSTWTKQTPYWF